MSAIADWTDYMRAAGCSPNTIRLRTSVVRLLAEDAGVEDPCEIPPRAVIRFLGRDRQPWTRRSYWASLAAWCRWCRTVELPGATLLDPVPVPPTPDPAARPIDDETIRRLLAAPMRSQTSSYVRLALFEAMRVHEIAKVRGEDFDLQSGWLTIEGKGRRVKPVPVHPEIEQLARLMPMRGWWFPSPADETKHVRPETVTRCIAAALSSVGSSATAHLSEPPPPHVCSVSTVTSGSRSRFSGIRASERLRSTRRSRMPISAPL